MFPSQGNPIRRVAILGCLYLACAGCHAGAPCTCDQDAGRYAPGPRLLHPGYSAAPAVDQSPSRFQPVPTRPVFTPREAAFVALPTGTSPPKAKRSGSNGGPAEVGPPPADAAPLPPVPEEVPPPQTGPKGVGTPAAPRYLSGVSGQPSPPRSWIFTASRPEGGPQRADNRFQALLPPEPEPGPQFRDGTVLR